MIIQPKTIKQINPSHYLYKHIKGLYLLNNGSGETVVDRSPHRNDFVFPDSNKPSWNGEGLEFNASYERVNSSVPSRTLINSEGTLILMYCNTVSSTFYYFVSPPTGYTDVAFYFLPSNNQYQLSFGQDSSQYYIDEPLDILDGEWHLMAFAWHQSDDKRKIWIDGRSDLAVTGGTFVIPDLNFIGFGGRVDNSNRSCGGIINWSIFLDYYMSDEVLNNLVNDNFPNSLFEVDNYPYLPAVGPTTKLTNYYYNNLLSGKC
jgi:hypothetical protein